jgi:hypothetical protein
MRLLSTGQKALKPLKINSLQRCLTTAYYAPPVVNHRAEELSRTPLAL